MLVLSRKTGQKIRIGDDVVISVIRVSGNRVQLGIEAPPEIRIHREEVYGQIALEQMALDESPFAEMAVESA